MEEIFLIKKLNGKLICGLNIFVGNSNSKFINSKSIFKNNSGIALTPCLTVAGLGIIKSTQYYPSPGVND